MIHGEESKPVKIKLGGCSLFSSTPLSSKGSEAWENKKPPFAWISKLFVYSASVNSKNGLRANPPPGLKMAAARGVFGNSSDVIFLNALLTEAASATSVLMPTAFPPDELISETTPS
jgi:hypothetical protein